MCDYDRKTGRKIKDCNDCRCASSSKQHSWSDPDKNNVAICLTCGIVV